MEDVLRALVRFLGGTAGTSIAEEQSDRINPSEEEDMTTHCRESAFSPLVGFFTGLLVLAVAHQPAWAADVNDANAFERSATAATPADHEALVTYFRGKADTAGKEAEMHEKMLIAAQGAAGGKNYAAMQPHCKELIRANREAQKSYEGLANLHAELAKH